MNAEPIEDDDGRMLVNGLFYLVLLTYGALVYLGWRLWRLA